MKVLAKREELCIGCQVCEDRCSTAYFKNKDRMKSCIQIDDTTEGSPSINVCNQCGECIEVCQVKAIYRDKRGIVRIKKDICVGCFMCVGFCPEEAMRQHDEFIEPFKCIACGLCAKECPSNAIYVDDIPDTFCESVSETATGLE